MKKLRAEGEHVAMADDGINDALGLSEAEARIAMGIPIVAGRSLPFLWNPLSPIIAGAAMSMSSVSVITNALRLRRVKAAISRFNPHHENHPSL